MTTARADGPANRTTGDPTAGTASLIASLQGHIDRVLLPLLEQWPSVVLLDYPAHENVGDSAIWLGTLALLRRAGVRVTYSCSIDTYSRAELARRRRGGVILIHGGGSFGDLWERPQRFREQVITDFPDAPIVQLPQTIHFEREEALARARAVLDAHPNLTLLARDEASLRFARKHFRAASHLCPDLAFSLGALARPVTPRQPLVWLARNDREAAPRNLPADVTPVDWIDARPDLAGRVDGWLRMQSAQRPRVRPALTGSLMRTANWAARTRLQRGLRLLASGRAVVTDRLHAHILSLLAGIPHVLLDNSYGKVSGFYDSWTRGAPLVQWADSAGHAQRLARELVQ